MGASTFNNICLNAKSADAVYEYLMERNKVNDYFEDYTSLRKKLCADPASRFPRSIRDDEQVEAFRSFIDAWPVEEAVSALAMTHWEQPYDICRPLHSFHVSPTPSFVTSKQTVAIVYHSLGIGGIENVIRFECSCWTRLGYKVVLLVDDGQEVCHLPDDVELVLLPDCFSSYGDRYYDRAKALKKALVKYEVCTVVHHQWLGLCMPWDLLLARCLGIQCIIQVHGVWFSAIGYELTDLMKLPLSYCIADSIVCLSDVDYEFWKTLCSNVYVTQNPTNQVFFEVASRPHPTKTVVWCGRLDVDKGLDDALLAIKEASALAPNAVFKLIGPYSNQIKRDLEERLGNLLISDLVQLCGAKSDIELAKEYETADVYFLSSLMEGWSLSLAEAKAAGLPCVMYELPYLTLCKPESGVLTAKLGDASGLGRQIARLLNDENLRKATSLSAKAQSLELASYSYSDFWKYVFAQNDRGAMDRSYDFRNASIMWESFYEMVQRKANEKHSVENEAIQLRRENAELIAGIERINSLLPVRICRRIVRLLRRAHSLLRKVPSR